jgi:serine/threonine protein kinase
VNQVPADRGPPSIPGDWSTSSVVEVPPLPLPEPTAVGGPDPPAESPEVPSKLLRPPQGPDELGRLGDYRVLRRLGEGGMGLIFEAEDIHLGRRVALKVIRPETGDFDVARKRFTQEARAVAAIDHENIVAIYHVGDDNGVMFLVMPLLQGESLADRLQRDGTLPIPEVLGIARQVALGLAAAHASALVHRDIKPANIFLERLPGRSESRVKILDFGLVRSVDAKGSNPVLTQAGRVVGTPGYMAPEQARGEPVDGRCDLFSLGCVIHRMATGQDPFQGANPVNVLVALSVDPATTLIRLRRDAPDRLSDLVKRLMAKKPSKRPASAEVVAEELAAIAAAPAPNRQDTHKRERTRPANHAAPKSPPDPAGTTALITAPAATGPADPEPGPNHATDEASQNVGACIKCRTTVRVLGGKLWCLKCGLYCGPAPVPCPAPNPRSRRLTYLVCYLLACCLLLSAVVVYVKFLA